MEPKLQRDQFSPEIVRGLAFPDDALLGLVDWRIAEDYGEAVASTMFIRI